MSASFHERGRGAHAGRAADRVQAHRNVYGRHRLRVRDDPVPRVPEVAPAGDRAHAHAHRTPPELFSRNARRIVELPTTLRLTRSTPSGSSSSRPSCRPASTTNLGYIVYARMIKLNLADELNGGMIRLTWRKFRGYVGQCRVGNPAAFEWFEWPYDRLTQYPLPKTDPAHVKYRDWRP